jgi:hypothetical protein
MVRPLCCTECHAEYLYSHGNFAGRLEEQQPDRNQEVTGSEALGKEMASLEEKIKEIQAAETDENLKSMYQHH